MKSTYQYSVIGVVLSVFLAALTNACWSSAPPAAPPPSTYYVKASGNDNNAGTSEDAPFKTLNKAIYESWARGYGYGVGRKTIVVIGTLTMDYAAITEGIGYAISNSKPYPTADSHLDVLITGKADAPEAERAVLRGNDKDQILRMDPVFKGSQGINGARIRLENITLTGGKADNGGAVYVGERGVLTLGPGAIITGNQAKNGGGVYAEQSNVFSDETIVSLEGGAITGNDATESGGGLYLARGKAEIKSGAITGNQAQSGGGVYASENAELILEGGEIANNIAVTSVRDGSIFEMPGYGGGVAAFNFTMKGGSISGNTVNGGFGEGGGVAIRNADLSKQGAFIMEGGEITNHSTSTNNITSMGNGAVSIFGNFTLRNGKIANNPTADDASGIYIVGFLKDKTVPVSFTMEGGEITGYGYAVSGTAINWTMRGGAISGNQVGVRLFNSSFTMRGGEITNNSTTKDAPAAGIIYSGSTVTIQGGKVSGNMVKGKEANLFEQK
jgi:hypothetical protein